ncbi:MAG: amidohydrolase family protein, partial [Flavobacteriales bacterium]|nr:amidohydrolase family protein [Flavobacteriales bacterium]
MKTEVDTIIHNATVYTVNGEFNIYEALAIDSGIIVAVGPEHEIMNAYQSAQTIDAKGRPIYPGFIDAHSHFLGYGLQLQRLNLVGTKSFEEVLDRVQQFIKDHDDEWITGRGWDQNDW